MFVKKDVVAAARSAKHWMMSESSNDPSVMLPPFLAVKKITG
jgi:hypothetical protein